MAKRTIAEIAELARADPGKLTVAELRVLRSMNRKAPRPDGEKQLAYSRRKVSEAADIGDIPAVVNPERRESCRLDLHRFLTTYFPHSTGLSPFSGDHLKQIGHMQACVLGGGWFVEAVYRGFAKTTISENTAIWAALYGHRRYIPVFGVNKDASTGNIESVKMELAENPLLAEDFPEACYAIARLENKPQRCKGQTQHGVSTYIVWRADTIVLPTVRVNGVVVGTAGTVIRAKPYAKSRGLVYKRPDGTQARPDFAIIDDPQDDESAATAGQVAKNLNILRKAILPSAGHRRRLACVVNATVICRADMIEHLLADTAWQGERIPMIRAWSTAHETLWRTYQEIRRQFDRAIPADKERAARQATEYYIANREEMDAGCLVSWASCYSAEDGEVSAIQHAYNMLTDLGEEVFASECQNQPLEVNAGNIVLTADQVAHRFNGRAVGEVPLACNRLTAFIDVHDKILYYIVCGWDEHFGGSIVDYGTFPRQHRAWFSVDDCNPELPSLYPAAGKEGAIQAGLEQLVSQLLNRTFPRSGGASMRIDRLHVDMGYMAKICAAVKFKAGGAAMWLQKGYGLKAGNTPMCEYKRKPGEEHGHYWYTPTIKGTSEFQHVAADVNGWKSIIQTRLTTAAGDRGALTINGESAEELGHLSEHITSEYYDETQGHGRTVQEWKLKPATTNNHWLDCLVGCAVAASCLKILTPEERDAPPTRTPRRAAMSLGEMKTRAVPVGGRR